MLADRQGRFLFELRPDLFPDGILTPVELALWAKLFESRKSR